MHHGLHQAGVAVRGHHNPDVVVLFEPGADELDSDPGLLGDVFVRDSGTSEPTAAARISGISLVPSKS